MENPFLIILLVFAAAAFTECCLGFAAMRSACAETRKNMIFIPITDETPDAEYILRETLAMIYSCSLPFEAVIVNMGADKETMEICAKIASENKIFRICSEKEAQKLLQSEE